jgi:hypothetical protein
LAPIEIASRYEYGKARALERSAEFGAATGRDHALIAGQ